ncbi:hypothetical protein E2C01_025342 [Portunus trituberculatus]|uniref:Uncharacterized protein n=1 Tax=Portunus trituberculatus TaxID=210409 RepID=A0A5B7ECP9_PORTR|nr:hypothetical protein [Portunus trituberculatus]
MAPWHLQRELSARNSTRLITTPLSSTSSVLTAQPLSPLPLLRKLSVTTTQGKAGQAGARPEELDKKWRRCVVVVQPGQPQSEGVAGEANCPTPHPTDRRGAHSDKSPARLRATCHVPATLAEGRWWSWRSRWWLCGGGGDGVSKSISSPVVPPASQCQAPALRHCGYMSLTAQQVPRLSYPSTLCFFMTITSAQDPTQGHLSTPALPQPRTGRIKTPPVPRLPCPAHTHTGSSSM